MLKDCLEVFKKKYDERGDRYILDNYILAEGTYLLINDHGDLELKQEISKKEKEIDRTSSEYAKFSELDYLSKLIDMNKPIDSSKVIHSNNYLSFFIKKENLSSGKLTTDIIEKYYEVLLSPEDKYGKNKKSLEIYQQAEYLYGKVDHERLLKAKFWILENIFSIGDIYDIKEGKNYLKIFFEAPIEIWYSESNKYILPNIYNASDYNVNMQDKLYGMPNDNLGLNSKKPYLRNKSRKNEVPYLISTEEVVLQKKFFDYLMNEVSQNKVNVYIDEDIQCFDDKQVKEKLENEYSGYYMRIQKGKEVEIKDFDVIENYQNKIKGFQVKRWIDIDYSKVTYPTKMNYNKIESLQEVGVLINQILFSGQLGSSYFREASDIKITDAVLKQSILQSRDAFFTWFYKGNDIPIRPLFNKMALRLIKNTICNGQRLKAQEQWMLKEGVNNYFNQGGEIMADVMKEVLKDLEIKVNGEETTEIKSDREYSIAVGQVAYYLLSLSKASSPTHAMINPIINSRNDQKLKEHLRILFKKYNYAIDFKGRRFRKLYDMVLGYEVESKIDENALLCGYLSNCILYKSKEGSKKEGGEADE